LGFFALKKLFFEEKNNGVELLLQFLLVFYLYFSANTDFRTISSPREFTV